MRIVLSPSFAFDVDDQQRSIAASELHHIAGYVIGRLKEIRPHLRVREVWANQTLYTVDVIASARARAFRDVANYESELRDAVELLMIELHERSLGEQGPLALEVRYDDLWENRTRPWEGCGYLHGRLLRVR